MNLQNSEHTGIGRDEILVRAYRRLYAPLCGYIRKRTGDIAGVEDMVQDVFLSLMSTDKLITEHTITRYAYACARNRVIDYMRHNACTAVAAEYFSNMQHTADEQASGRADARLVGRIESGVLGGVGEKGRGVYLLSMYAGLSAREIAARMDISERTVENHLQRVRNIVRREIRKVI